MRKSKSSESSLRRRKDGSHSEHSRNGTVYGSVAKGETERPLKNTAGVVALWSFVAAAPFLGYFLFMTVTSCSKSGHINVKESQNSTPFTNEADKLILAELEAGDILFYREQAKLSMKKFSEILVSHPGSPRALWGYARSLQAMTKGNIDSDYYQESLKYMREVLVLPEVPLGLAEVVMYRLVRYYVHNEPHVYLENFWKFLSKSRPNDPDIKRLFAKELAQYPKKTNRAEQLYKELINDNPDDCESLRLLAKMYKKAEKQIEEAAKHLHRAIHLDCDEVRTLTTYTDLIELYVRLERMDKVMEVAELGEKKGLYLSRWQRSHLNADTPLTARPWWTYKQTTYEKSLMLLENNWMDIREEALAILNTDRERYHDDTEKLTDEGIWQKLILYRNGRRNDHNCKIARKTCELLSQIPDSTTLTRGQIKFSVLTAGTHIWAHCGPTNCRIRAHLGLVIPEGPRLRVCNDTRTWEEGKFVIFDDSFEHEVWHDGKDGDRLILIVDFWHPEITMEQRKRLKPYN